MLCYKTIGNLMHEINNNSCPSSISHCVTHSRQIHNYNTRHCVSNNFYIKYSRLNRVGTSFVRYGAKFGTIFLLMCVNWVELILIK